MRVKIGRTEKHAMRCFFREAKSKPKNRRVIRKKNYQGFAHVSAPFPTPTTCNYEIKIRLREKSQQSNSINTPVRTRTLRPQPMNMNPITLLCLVLLRFYFLFQRIYVQLTHNTPSQYIFTQKQAHILDFQGGFLNKSKVLARKWAT